MKQNRNGQKFLRKHLQKFLLQKVIIEAEVVRGENEEEETKVSFFKFYFLLHYMKAYGYVKAAEDLKHLCFFL